MRRAATHRPERRRQRDRANAGVALYRGWAGRGRRLVLESLEQRSLLAAFVLSGAPDLSGSGSYTARYDYVASATESQQDSGEFYAAQSPHDVSLGMSNTASAHYFGDVASGSISSQVAPLGVHLTAGGHVGAMNLQTIPANLFVARSSHESFLINGGQYTIQILPTGDEKIGDMVGVSIHTLLTGGAGGADINTAPQGVTAVWGNYSYSYQVSTPDGKAQGSHSAAGTIVPRMGDQTPLDEFSAGPLNVPIGSQIVVTLRLTGDVVTNDLRGSAQLNANFAFDLGFSAADLAASSLSWNVGTATDQGQRKLDFTYLVNPERDPLKADAEIGFYWANGVGGQDLLGSFNQPIYRYKITEPYQKTQGFHADSVPLSTLGAPPVGAAYLVMIVDPQLQVADIYRDNNRVSIASLPDVQALSLDWNTRRDQDPYGGWRGVDARYAVQTESDVVGLSGAFYWSATPALSGRIGGPLATRPMDVSLGLQQFNESALWGTPPSGAQYVLFAIDPDDNVAQWDEGHNVVSLRVHSAGEILQGSLNLNPGGGAAPNGASPDMNARFVPGGGSFTISEAEVALGVHHFNWLQEVYSAPAHWSLYQDYGDAGVIPLPWLDPSKDVPNQKYLILHSAIANSDERFADNPNDGQLFYYNEPGFDHSAQMTVEGATTSSYLKFFDSPRVPANFIVGPAESWSFVCSLEGVDAQGQIVPLPAPQQRTFTWRSNAVYNAQDPRYPLTGGGVFLQLLDPALAPPVIAGGVDRVQMLNVDPPVAVDDIARTEAGAQVAVRVLANDYDSQHAPLSIAYVSQPQHGTLSVNDAGTSTDLTDDWLDYTPAPGFTGVDSFAYMISRTDGSIGSNAARVTITVTSPLPAVGVAGDDLSFEYATRGLTYAQSWVEVLANVKGISFGAQGSWEAPRDDGYQYDWARGSTTAQTLLRQQQDTGLAQQIRAGQVTHAVLMVGANDFLPGTDAYDGIYQQGLARGWNAAQIEQCVSGVLRNIETALATLRAENAQVLLSNLFDYSLTPRAAMNYPSAARRALVSDVVAQLNQRLVTLAAKYHVPLLDVAGLMGSLLGANAQPVAAITVGGVEFTNTAGQGALNLFLIDGLHPHTLLSSLLANLVLEGFHQGYGANVSLLTESQMLDAAQVRYGGDDTLPLDYARFVILSANQAPLAVANHYVIGSSATLSLSAAAGLLANDSDPDRDPLRAVLVDGGPVHGALVFNPDGSFNYQPAVGFAGRDSFRYQAGDGRALSGVVTVTIDVIAAARQSDAFTPGAYVPGSSVFFLRNTNTLGMADVAFGFGAPGAGWIPLQGDWNGTLSYGVGLYAPATSQFFLTSTLATGPAEIAFGFGAPGAGWIPLTGDFNGDGRSTVGLFDPLTSRFYLRNSHTTGVADVTVAYGAAGAGWIPLIGDWDGDGTATVGLYDPVSSVFFLRNTNTTGMADITFGYGAPGAGWIPVVGDWDGDGRQSVGLFDPQTSYYYLTNTHATGPAEFVVGFGMPRSNWKPLAGDWDASRAAALQAVSTAAVQVAAQTLQDAELQALLKAALNRWAAAGLNAEQLDRLARVQLSVADLPGAVLGRSFAERIVLDRDAAGFGWFVDLTPDRDEEFLGGAVSLTAVDPRALDKIDLLTVVEHELGHVLGLDDLDPALGDLMSGTLAAGLRRLP